MSFSTLTMAAANRWGYFLSRTQFAGLSTLGALLALDGSEAANESLRRLELLPPLVSALLVFVIIDIRRFETAFGILANQGSFV